jgi:hypothetical protein
MTVDKQSENDFREFVEPLEALERAFNAAAKPIKFHAFVDPVYGKVIKIIGGNASQKIICIDADSLGAGGKGCSRRGEDMSAELSVCPVCTEFEQTPVPIGGMNKSQNNKYLCNKCGAEFWLKITKEPDYKNFELEDQNGKTKTKRKKN